MKARRIFIHCEILFEKQTRTDRAYRTYETDGVNRFRLFLVARGRGPQSRAVLQKKTKLP